MLISGETTIDRTVTLVVSESKDVSSVSIAICDYNHDGSIDGLDKLSFYEAFSGGAEDYNLYCDFNKDNAIDGLDKLTFFTFFGNEVKYADVTLN